MKVLAFLAALGIIFAAAINVPNLNPQYIWSKLWIHASTEVRLAVILFLACAVVLFVLLIRQLIKSR